MFKKTFCSGATIFITLLCVSLIISSFLVEPTYANGVTLEVIGSEQGLRLEPADEKLFFITKKEVPENEDEYGMYPGRTESSKVIVKNEGNHKFSYTISTKTDDEDNLLYKQLNLNEDSGLLMIVTDQNGNEHHRESIKKLKDLDMGNLSAGDFEELTFTLHLLEGSGNEFQNLALDFVIVFEAKGDTPDTPGPPGPPGGGGGHGGGGTWEPGKEPPAEEEIIEPEEPEVTPGEEPEEEPEDLIIEPETPRVKPPGELPLTTGSMLWMSGVGTVLVLLGRKIKNSRKAKKNK